MEVSSHAYKRLHERSGLNSKASERLVERVLERGYRRTQLHGRLRKWVDSKSELNTDNETDCVVYGDKLFIFKEKRKVLVTVLQIPANLTKDLTVFVNKQKGRQNEKKGNNRRL